MVKQRIFINTLKIEVKLNFSARNYFFFDETWQYSETAVDFYNFWGQKKIILFI